MSDTMHAPIENHLTRLNRDMLARPRRTGHVLLLLAALGMAVLLAALLLTEPALPVRTTAAFGVMLAIALGWSGYAVWVLSRKRPLYGRHAVVAGWMGVSFTALYTGGALAVWILRASPAAGAAAGFGLLLLAVAVFVLVRAQRRVRALEACRRTLEQTATP